MDQKFLYIPVLCITLITAYKGYGYFKNKFYRYVMAKVNEELDRRMQNEEQLFKPIHKNSAVITINQGGKNHSVYVPYDRRKSSSMLSKKVFLIKDGEKVEISQKPGIPYLVSAAQLGGSKIIVQNIDGEVIKTFEENEIPNYL